MHTRRHDMLCCWPRCVQERDLSTDRPQFTPIEQLVTPPHGQADTEATLSRDEKLRRERQRAYAVGVTSYAWAGPGGRILVPMQVCVCVCGWVN